MLTLYTRSIMYPINWSNVPLALPEDAARIGFHKPIFVVADGVTRSSKVGQGNLSMALGAHNAANIFCNTVMEFLQLPIPLDASILREAFIAGNNALSQLNKAYGVSPENTDWLKRDLFGVCAALGFLADDMFFFGWIGDCGVAVFDSQDVPKLITPEKVSALERFRDGLQMPEDQRMIFWRRELRNHPGMGATYGVATGQREAEPYFEQGAIPVKEGDLLLLYTDSMGPVVIGDKNFRDALRSKEPGIPPFPYQEHSDATVISVVISQERS
ncbi:MAG: protein phosphatase 2C domain-containing protein [Candidatus Wildermuthbacteria bacterium]|nr:protein phosphatase 2C domain-containing protein [Candidatus Wildermuthbacteria bacterium]